MGQKVHPRIFRINDIFNWNSRWFSRKDFAKLLKQDVRIRDYLWKQLKDASVDRIDIERTGANVIVIVHTAKPGFIIGRAGSGAEELKDKLSKKFRIKKGSLNLNIVEVQRPSLSAMIMMQNMAVDLEKRLPFRRVMKQALDRIEKAGGKGGKVEVAGRLNGAEIARTETLSFGKVPLHNLRAEIDYAQGFAKTLFGTIGVKVWIFKGEVFKEEKKEGEAQAQA